MNQEVVNKIQTGEYKPRLRSLHRNSILANPEALLCESNLNSEVNQISQAK